MRKVVLLLALILSVPTLSVDARQSCAPPVVPTPARAANIFTESQEVDLGDAIAEQVQRGFRVIDSAEITAPLKRIGERIARHLPPTQLNFRFFMIDLPDINAFVLPGGRIYVSRKLVAFAESEDELGGVLAHEIGHLVARQHAIAVTRQLKDVLGVTRVGDRADIFEKYHQLLENSGRKPEAFRQSEGHEDAEQIVADRIGLYASAVAGYDPQASAQLWDRFAQTKGKTGGFFSDLFGATKPEARRLREMTKALGSLPPSCIEKRSSSTDEYRAWKSAVLTYTLEKPKESLHGVLSKTELQPRLRGEIHHLRFSSDGRYVIAQDDSGIDVLSREPFAPLFRIPALDASRARFTPDSKSVVFYNADLRVELWSVAEGKLKEAHELFMRAVCRQTALSPDGHVFACLDSSRAVTLFDVAGGKVLFERKDFYHPSALDLLLVLANEPVSSGLDSEDAPFLSMDFSPDGRYFAASQKVPAGLTATNFVDAFVVDLETRSALRLRGQIERLLAGGLAFTGPDRLVAFNAQDPKKSALIVLPQGDLLKEFPLPPGKISAVAHGDFIVVRPYLQFALGVIDINKGEANRVSESAALDIYDGAFVSERLNGELGLYGPGDSSLLASTQLPGAPLGRLRAAAVSADFAWLAVSERTRGAAWDLREGKRVFLSRGFRSGAVASDGTLTAEFPKFRQIERQTALVALNRPNTPQQLREIKPVPGETFQQVGAFLTVLKADKKGGGAGVLEFHEPGGSQPLWTKSFPHGVPDFWVSSEHEVVVFAWALLEKGAQAEIKANASLQQKTKGMKERQGDYLFEMLNARSGEVLGHLIVETGNGSFRIDRVSIGGDAVILGDDQNRVLVYSLSTGEKNGQVFGTSRAASGKAGNLLAVENGDGLLSVYSLESLKKRAEFVFSSRVALAQFSPDGKRLFVLTADQIAYVLDMTLADSATRE